MLNNIEIVEIINNQPMTNSLKIAEVFSKRHDAVLRDIKKLKCSQEFNLHNFVEVNYAHTNGATYPMYNITKDGFVFLVMGYTGEKACQFKELYIKTFNKMEQDLKTPAIKQNLTPHDLDKDGFYLLPLTCAVSPSQLRYKIIKGTIYFKVSDIDTLLGVSRRDFASLRRDGDIRTATNYSIHNVLQDIGITPYSSDYLLNIWQILELCNHLKTRRAELLENILCYKIKPYFEKKIIA